MAVSDPVQGAVGAVVILMMVAIGLKTSWEDFKGVVEHRHLLVRAAVLNLLIIPVLTLVAGLAADMPPDALTGFLLCGVSPGGPVGALFAVRAGGHVVLAVTALIGLSLASLLTVPSALTLLLGLGAQTDIKALVMPMTTTLLLFQIMPLLLGMGIRWRWPERAERWARPATTWANIGLLALVLGFLTLKGSALLVLGFSGAVLSVGLVGTSLLLGLTLTRASAPARSMAMVTSARNLSLALLLSAHYFPAPLTTAAVLTYGLTMMVLPLLAGRLLLARASQG